MIKIIRIISYYRVRLREGTEVEILILGGDGYIGFPLAMHLTVKGHSVTAVDNFSRRKWVRDICCQSATPIGSMPERLESFYRIYGKKITFEYGDLTDYGFVAEVLAKYRPEAVIHLAEQASAPFSMMGIRNATLTQTNNLVSTINLLYAIKTFVPECHLVKLGSMGEYQAVNVDIPEGSFEVEYRGRKAEMMFPRTALNDWYHWSKVYDSGNIMMACDIWGLRSTDIMQGIVYGTRTDEMAEDSLLTRFDFDDVFGTVLNRFCAQAALEYNLTCYGKGFQKKPVIALRDTIECLRLAAENPAQKGEYRVFNQFDEVYTIREMAEKVRNVARNLGFVTDVTLCQNPRVENDSPQYFNPLHDKLAGLGFRAQKTLEEELRIILTDLSKYRERLVAKREKIHPKVSWDTALAREENGLVKI